MTEQRGPLAVTVAVPTNKEAKQLFGVDLADLGIQPVWIEIQNDGPGEFWFMHHGLDPNYFSAREAAYKGHLRWRGHTNRRMDEHFGALGIDPRVPAHGRNSGFAFSNLKLGTKEVRIRLFGEKQIEDFSFFVTVPGFRADWQEVDLEEIWTEDEIVELGSEQGLYDALMTLPCCTTRADGTGKGDPLNIVVIGSGDEMNAFIRAGWDETEVLTASSAWKTFKAFWGGEYKYSPMSALYVYGRPQDLSLQKARDTIHERNHLRLWVTPWTYRGKRVWVGGISRDIGVYFTTRAWNLTTHAIDPDIDEARTYLTEDLATAQTLEKIGLVPGVGAATPEGPHRNLMDAPWWTDGMRDVCGWLRLSNLETQQRPGQPLANLAVPGLAEDPGGFEAALLAKEGLDHLEGQLHQLSQRPEGGGIAACWAPVPALFQIVDGELQAFACLPLDLASA